MAAKYLNPFTDFGFKKLFGSEPNKDLLIDFLNELLPEHHQIKELSFSQNEQMGASELDRKAIFDLYCVSPAGERFIVEMQKAKQNYFKDRSVYYTTFPIQEQAQRGEEWDFKLAAVYLIGVLDFVFAEDKDDTEVLHTVQLKDQENRVFYDKLTYLYLEMPKFTKTEAELVTNFDKWLYVLKYLPKLTSRPARLQGKLFGKLFQTAELAKFSRQERQQYERSLKYYRDMKNVIDTAAQESKAEGIAEGIAQGIIEGELKKATEIARNLLQMNLPMADIIRATGLSEAEIKALQP